MLVFQTLLEFILKELTKAHCLQCAFSQNLYALDAGTCRDGTKIRRSLKGHLIWQVSE